MDRRTFLHRGLAAGAAGVAGLSAPALAAPTSPPGSSPSPRSRDRRPGHAFRTSLAAYSFRNLLQAKGGRPRMSLEDVIDFAADQGLDGVELTSYYFQRTDPEFLSALKRRAFLNGLAITGTPVGNNFCHPPGAERDRQLEHVRTWVDHAAHLGAPCIRIFAGTVPEGTSGETAHAWCVENLKTACAHAASRGVVLALENHGGITARAEQLRRLVEDTASPWCAVNLDTGNFHRDVYGEIEKVADLAVVVQHKVEVRDENGKKVPSDLDRILDLLEAVGFRGFIALEYEAAGDPLVEVPRHLRALREAIARR